ncbi:MAG: class I SAM-dependent methyltransferase, partial [Planctomycetota bacterium]
MNINYRHRIKLALILFSFTLSIVMAQSQSQIAKQILDTTGVKGGLVIHTGCGDGKLTAALRVNDRYLVQGLDRDTKNIQKAREYIQSLGIYGKVSVDHFDGQRLPYVDNLVNLVIAENPGKLKMDEIMRVICPRGTAYVKQKGKWTKTVKPRPEEIDEWTHYLYDASGNAVSHDMIVGPPRHFQWTGSPRWARHHDRRASVSAMVSSGDRIFYIIDEGSNTSIMLPPKTVLVARDAFN